MNRIKLSAISSVIALSVFGCAEYDKPEYVDVDTSETAYVVPLEGDTSDQAKFQSVAFLESKKVAAKRIQINHRWNKTGRMWWNGEWIDLVRVVKVDRSPVTRQWDADKNKETAIWLESQDSVGFSIGFNATAMIKEEDASQFLYHYKNSSLAQVMDSEIRNRFMQVGFEVAKKYPLDVLRSRSSEIVDAIRKDAIEYFAGRGITITMIGMYGGMTYENPNIQAAIDNVFVAQQEKAVNLAKFEAQQKANERIELEAMAIAEKNRTLAQGEADAKVKAAEGEAKSLKLRAEAIRETGPALFDLRRLEIEQQRVEKWDGKYPVYFMGSGTDNLLMQVPAPSAQAVEQSK